MDLKPIEKVVKDCTHRLRLDVQESRDRSDSCVHDIKVDIARANERLLRQEKDLSGMAAAVYLLIAMNGTALSLVALSALGWI